MQHLYFVSLRTTPSLGVNVDDEHVCLCTVIGNGLDLEFSQNG